MTHVGGNRRGKNALSAGQIRSSTCRSSTLFTSTRTNLKPRRYRLSKRLLESQKVCDRHLDNFQQGGHWCRSRRPGWRRLRWLRGCTTGGHRSGICLLLQPVLVEGFGRLSVDICDAVGLALRDRALMQRVCGGVLTGFQDIYASVPPR